MYQAESLIAPKALPAKLLPWNVTLPRYPRTLRPSPKTAFPRVPVAPSRFLSLCRQCARSLALAAPSYVINSFPALPTPWQRLRRPGPVLHIVRICGASRSWHFVALENIVAIRLRDAKSDVRKPVYRIPSLSSPRIFRMSRILSGTLFIRGFLQQSRVYLSLAAASPGVISSR